MKIISFVHSFMMAFWKKKIKNMFKISSIEMIKGENHKTQISYSIFNIIEHMIYKI